MIAMRENPDSAENKNHPPKPDQPAEARKTDRATVPGPAGQPIADPRTHS